MKPHTIVTLLGLSAVMGVSVLILKKTGSGEQKEITLRAPGQTLLEVFPADKAGKIVISGAGKSTSLSLKDSKWTVDERDSYPANSKTVNEFLRSLAELKVTQSIEAGPSFAPRFGMDENATSAESRGITTTIKDSSGMDLATVSFGKNLESTESSSPFGGGAVGRYVRNHGDVTAFYAVSESFDSLQDDPKSWLDDRFLKMEKIKSVSISQAGTDKMEWAFTRTDENADFSFTDAFPGVKAAAAATAPLKSLFSYSRFDDVVPTAELGKRSSPNKIQKAIISTFDGITYTLTIQPAKEPAASEAYLMTIAVEANLAKERVKPVGEKEEDAATAQKAFDEKLKTLTESVEKTKELSGITYEVSKSTIDTLLKNRTDFMDKGPEPNQATQAPNVAPGTAAYTPSIQIPPPSTEESPSKQ